MKRRADDPESFDAAPLRNGRTSILQTVLKYGLSTFLVLYLLGVFSYVGLKPPYFDFRSALDAHEQKMDERDQRTLDTLRGICLGVWQGWPEKQNTFCNR